MAFLSKQMKTKKNRDRATTALGKRKTPPTLNDSNNNNNNCDLNYNQAKKQKTKESPLNNAGLIPNNWTQSEYLIVQFLAAHNANIYEIENFLQTLGKPTQRSVLFKMCNKVKF